jgi:multidrug efflux pump subunit AcrA (membrane-fusion protein)
MILLSKTGQRSSNNSRSSPRTTTRKRRPPQIGGGPPVVNPYRGTLNYVSPSIDRATGTLAVRAILANSDQVLVPGNFVRVRVAAAEEQESLLVPDAALGSDQGGRFSFLCRSHLEGSQAGRSSRSAANEVRTGH